MKITVFGVGYVGLVQAAVFAESGHHVVCVDVDTDRINNLKKGIIPIYEPGLDSLVSENFSVGRLEFTCDAKHGVEHGLVQFIAVGTPPDEDGSADLKYVLAVAETIATYMIADTIIVDKSTVPVGTADKVRGVVADGLRQRGVELEFDVVSNPEFLKEGSAIADCKRPDRIIIGAENAATVTLMHDLYAPMNRNHERMVVMDIKSAELTKYAANAMLATKISFMSEIAILAEHMGADIEAVRRGIGSDTRIGYHFIYPGCGYGGSCFPKDVQALMRMAAVAGYETELLNSVEAVNERQKIKLFKKISQHFLNNLKGKTFALWGLSFKPNTDDMREAPSRVLMESLWAVGAKVQAYDPEAMTECERIYGHRDDLKLMNSQEAVLENADALVIVTDWQQFKVLDFTGLKKKLNQPLIFDGRNLFEPTTLREHGFQYYSIGRA